MTTTLFSVLLFAVSIILFLGIGIPLSFALGDTAGIGISAGITIIFISIFCAATPSQEQMAENDYYMMLYDRPKCIDDRYISLGCKKDYIEWQKDSIKKQHKYDSAKVKLENIQNKIIPVASKAEPTNSTSIKACIDKCWAHALNADVKICQDNCF